MAHNDKINHTPHEGKLDEHTRPPKPVPLVLLPEHIPTDLKALHQWVIWRYIYKPDLGYWDKPPLDATKSGNAAKSTDPKTWATFDKALSSYQLGTLDGIGLALTEKNGIVGFDLDHCRDPHTGEIAPWALTIVEQVRTYWEISTSATGCEASALVASLGGAAVPATLKCIPWALPLHYRPLSRRHATSY